MPSGGSAVDQGEEGADAATVGAGGCPQFAHVGGVAAVG